MSYREEIRREFERRRIKNGRYSLRAFSRDIGVGVSILSACLSGRRHLSPMNLRKIQAALSWPQDKFASALKEIDAKTKPIRGAKTHDLPTSVLIQLQNWYTLAILNLARMPSNKASPSWLAKRLNITPAQAKGSLDCLIQAGLVDVIDRKLVVKSGGRLRFPTDTPDRALQSMQRQLSARATESLDKLQWPERLFLASLFNGDRKDLKQAISRIHRFGDSMRTSLKRTEGNDVLALVVHVFPLTETM